MSWKGKERRSAKRVQVVARVELGGEDQANSVVYTRDLSTGGLFIETDKLPEIGTAVSLAISIPGVRQLLPVTGKVVRHQINAPHGFGVQFDEMPEEFQMLLEDTIVNAEQQ